MSNTVSYGDYKIKKIEDERKVTITFRVKYLNTNSYCYKSFCMEDESHGQSQLGEQMYRAYPIIGAPGFDIFNNNKLCRIDTAFSIIIFKESKIHKKDKFKAYTNKINKVYDDAWNAAIQSRQNIADNIVHKGK